MIKRRALLIGGSGRYRNLRFLEGVAVGLANYRYFLQSKAGGEWHADEIHTLLDPNANEVVESIRQSYDYTHTVFSGYGAIDTYTQSDTVFLNDIDLPIGKLVSSSLRQTIIVDACRQFVPSWVPLPQPEPIVAPKGDFGKSTREIFDEAIGKTPEGVILIFSCLPGQELANDALSGGYFTQSLIRAGEYWGCHRRNTEILAINEAVEEAKRVLVDVFLSRQTPEMVGQIRRLKFPPFAIGTR